MNVIEARQLTRVFAATRAVDSVSLEVAPGTVLGLLGPNGAGKSTLLKLLVGHLRATSGSAAILGQAVWPRHPELWRHIGYVSQSRYLPSWMTAAECLRFSRGFHPHWDDAKVRRLVERLELPLNAHIRDMSRGHSVRLQIALALGHNPELILLDEPTSGLDPVGRRELLAILINLIIVYVVLRSLKFIERLLGPAGLIAVRKFFGVILLAIAVKIFATNAHGLIK